MSDGESGGLARIKLLRSLAPDEVDLLERQCRWQQYASGEEILGRASATREVLFVTSGSVRIVNYSSTGREVAFAVVEAGGHVGELSAIDGGTRSATVVAAEACRIGMLSPEHFKALLFRNANIAFELLRYLACIIRIGDERIAELSTVGAVQRVFRELLRLAEPSYGDASFMVAPLPTQHDIASKVGATRETVARALGQLVNAGVVRRRGRTLLILDPTMLESLADPDAESGLV